MKINLKILPTKKFSEDETLNAWVFKTFVQVFKKIYLNRKNLSFEEETLIAFRAYFAKI